MTSPNINKPKPTNEKYNDIYSRGSSFGQDLTESGVRKLLTGRVKSPLSQFLQWGANLIGSAVNDIVNVLTGEGASYEVLTGAAVERLGDIRTQITEAAKDFQNLADKAEELGTKQDGILEDISAQGVVIEQAKTDASKAIKDAGTVSTALEQYQSLNDTKVRSAVATAEGANKAITDLNTQFASKVNSQIASSSTISDIKAKASTALADSGKAIDWLESGVQVSNSALPLIPGTSTPTWTEGLVEVKKGEDDRDNSALPSNITTFYSSGKIEAGQEKIVKNPYRNTVTVDSRIEYEASWWLRSVGSGSRYVYVTLCDETGNRHIIERLPATELDNNPSQYTWGIPIRALITEPDGTGWTKFTTRFKFKEGVTKVRVYDINFSNTGNSSFNYLQIADLQINPAIPSQADVDRAQNKAIQSHDLLWDKQSGWNATQEKINKLNSAMWDKQGEVNTANVKAIKALARIDIGGSLVAYADITDGDIKAGITTPYRPSWATAAPIHLGKDHSWMQNPEVKGLEAWGAYAEYRTISCEENWVNVIPGQRYKVSYWHRANLPNSRYYIRLKTPDGETDSCLESGPGLSGSGAYLVANLVMPTTWEKVEFYIQFKPGITKVSFSRIYWNHSSGRGTANQYIAGLDIVPDIPTQADVNKALLDSDEALKKLAKEIDDRSQLNTAFNTEQKRINGLVQQQLWNHQDMIEQLDIRAPKTAGRKMHEGPYEEVSYTNAKGYHTTHPYFEIWAYGNKTVVAAMRGSWVGQYEVNINWDNGAIDRWTVDVTDTKRVFKFTGGAAHINIRYITSTVFPRSLCRKATVSRYGNTISPQDVVDPEGLVRAISGTRIRLKNRATCNTKVYYKDDQDKTVTISPGRVIPSGTLFWADKGSIQLKEVADPGKGEYSVGSSTPPNGSAVSAYNA